LYADPCCVTIGHDPLQRSWPRSVGSVRIALPALILLIGAAGFAVTSHAIRKDRDADAERHAEVVSVHTQTLLARARAYVAGLGNALAGEPAPGQRRFARLAGSTAGGVGLVDALWVEDVPDSERRAYERRLGSPITRLTPSGGSEPAPRARSYLAVTFTSRTRPELRPGVDVSGWPALARAIRDPASAFAVSASGVGSLGAQPGFYLLRRGSFGREPDTRGYLAVFFPRGWWTVSLDGDPSRVSLTVDDRLLEGGLDSAPVAGASFEALARRWRVDVASEPRSALQATLPWLALAWPAAAALVAFLIARGIARRRRAEREAERIFDLSLDLLCVAGLDGYFKRVNPAFERTLGYTSEQLLSRPFAELVHVEDRERTRTATEALGRGEQVVQFENRYICADGSERWLEWSVRPVPDQGMMYGAARDVTERRRAEDQLRRAQQLVAASRDELRVLADEQAALRRVATLVAHGGSPQESFAAVASEMGRLLGADATSLLHLEPDGTVTVVAFDSRTGAAMRIGARLALDAGSDAAAAWRAGRAARMDRFDGPAGSFAALLTGLGARSAVGAPIVVEGRVWGAIVAAWMREQPVSADTEGRMAQFTELVATAVANAESRAELIASRARLVAAADETRRRIERDLHDGTQQRLVSLALALRAAEAQVPPEHDELRSQLAHTASGLAGAVEDLQEISRGIHPAILSKGGLKPAIKTLARRSPVPVELDVRGDRRLPEAVEAAAYYIVSEALTNTAKHARASVAHVGLAVSDAAAELTISDDGVGGADLAKGSGLVGLRDRVEALGGTIALVSSPGAGTSLHAIIPIGPVEALAG
jgi:PAS domain S-box-containing protein